MKIRTPRLAKAPSFGALATLVPVLAVLTLSTFATSCRSSAAEDPILRLSAEESLVQGKELLNQKKFARARPYLSHAFEVEPNSAGGREALLLVADCHFLERGNTNFIQAEAKYRDFLNRFPTSTQAAYAQFQIANSLAERIERPDRDQGTTRKTLAAYQDLLRLFPTSEYAAQAREKISTVRLNLAEHEFVVGRFYLRFGAAQAAVGRFETILRDYPEYRDKDKIIYHLGLAHSDNEQPEEASKAFERLRTEYPESPYSAEIPKRAVTR